LFLNFPLLKNNYKYSPVKTLMLDLLFNTQKAEKKPFEIAILAIFYSSLSVLLGLWVFGLSTSLAIVFLSTLSCTYIIQNAIKIEEKKEKDYNSEKWILKQHKGIVILILALFLGFVISFSLWSIFLEGSSFGEVFELQQVSVEQIKSITGNIVDVKSSFSKIFINNFNIILISLIFAVFYGAGAVYILVWNASVMGYVIGTNIKYAAGISAVPITFLRYSLHGIPEMIAYIIAALAGGILYFAFIKGDITRQGRSKRILIDVVTLISISIFILVISALLEIYLSPLI